MDRTILQILTENWGTLMAAPLAFIAASALGAIAGWLLAKIVYSNRLTHHQELLTHYRDVIDEKFPASSLPPRKRMSIGLVITGLVISAIGLGVSAIGLFSNGTDRQQQTKLTTPQQPSLTNAMLPDDKGAVSWQAGYLLGAGGDDNGIKISTLQMTGWNNSDQFLGRLGGFIKSEITGETFPLQANVNGVLSPLEKYGIPARHQFMLGAKISDNGISGAAFLKQFERMTFTFKYDDHTYTKTFSPDELEAEVARTEKDLRPKPLQSRAGFSPIDSH